MKIIELEYLDLIKSNEEIEDFFNKIDFNILKYEKDIVKHGKNNSINLVLLNNEQIVGFISGVLCSNNSLVLNVLKFDKAYKNEYNTLLLLKYFISEIDNYLMTKSCDIFVYTFLGEDENYFKEWFLKFGFVKSNCERSSHTKNFKSQMFFYLA